MSYKTILGREISLPMETIGTLPQNMDERDKTFLYRYAACFNTAVALDNEVISLREQCKKLTYENEFMLKLINSRHDE